MRYSDTFAHTITSIYGTMGEQWLRKLPSLVVQCSVKWNLTGMTVFSNLTYNYVLAGTRNNAHIVLKLRCDRYALEKEVAALRAFQGPVCVKVIEYDQQLGALLLEQIIPGVSLSALVFDNDAQATTIAGHLIQQLHQAVPSDIFPTLEKIIPTFDKESQELKPFIAHASMLKQQLLATQPQQVLLHGDFHHENILSQDNVWMVIDPEGIVGDPGYDLAVFIRNPLKLLVHQPHVSMLIKNRIVNLATCIGYDTQRLYDWTYLQTVVSAYWSVEDGLDISNHVTFLQILESIK